MKELKDLAGQFKTLAEAYAPRRTGNLKNQILSYNNASNMIRKEPSGQNILVLTYAPSGATYGKWWNDPTVSYQVRNQRTGNKDKINFAKQAAEDPQFIKSIEEYMAGQVDTVVQSNTKQLTVSFQKLGSTNTI